MAVTEEEVAERLAGLAPGFEAEIAAREASALEARLSVPYLLAELGDRSAGARLKSFVES